MNEARAAGTLAHENIAAVYDMGTTADGSHYLVMEFLDGQDCEHLVAMTHGALLRKFSSAPDQILGVTATEGVGAHS